MIVTNKSIFLITKQTGLLQRSHFSVALLNFKFYRNDTRSKGFKSLFYYNGTVLADDMRTKVKGHTSVFFIQFGLSLPYFRLLSL